MQANGLSNPISSIYSQSWFSQYFVVRERQGSKRETETERERERESGRERGRERGGKKRERERERGDTKEISEVLGLGRVIFSQFS